MRNLIGAVILVAVALVLLRVAPPALTAVRAARGGLFGTAVDGGNAASVPVAPAPKALPAVAPLRVLFIGNSHTYVNDLPQLVMQLAVSGNQRCALQVSMIVAGGATLAEHLAGAQVRPRLSEARWDYVVLQEQQQRPSWTFDPKRLDAEFFAPARTLDVLIRAASAKTILFMTPARQAGDKPLVPDDTYEKMQDRTRDGYVRLATEIGAKVAPVGLAWRWVHQRRPDLQLWAADGYHPALAGSYLGACVFYSLLCGAAVLDNPFTAGLPAADVGVLQLAADTARFL
jgi:hypothetical protein